MKIRIADIDRINSLTVTLSLVHTSHRLQQLSQRARLQQIIGKLPSFTATDWDSCWLQQIRC